MNFKKDKLDVKIYETRDAMGKGAADDIAVAIKKCLSEKEEINMIFAAAPSQNDMLYHLCERDDIEWERINAFHMDEYIGLASDAPQCFSNFLKRYIFDLKPFKSVNLINAGANSAEEECARYSKLLIDFPVDIVCMGIGENGHIAFNDPHVADFNDKALVKPVTLDDVCRMQQVNDGCFESIDQVPTCALTLTVPALMKATYNFCVVPAPTKAVAVKRTVEGEINEECPATILRLKDNAIMYCDADSSALLDNK
ncbi:MAG: glucosamine-6-phosphate deaminase [Clostridia bacterium]|nr:glucosamine-6-phosphate deaminase [Clostridia bacterium]